VEEVHPVAVVAPEEPAVVRFMNTIWADRVGIHDALETREDLAIVLDALGRRPVGEVSDLDLQHARLLRRALRRVAAAETADDRPRALSDLSLSAALKQINRVLTELPARRLEQTETGWTLDSVTTTVRHALADLARDGALLFAEPEHPVRACRAPGCVLYFVQQHARREWCSPECGNRARAARHYDRHRRVGRN
jgi:predicted RNA-binding Zn ribbon-like protein